jgi:hypothetical protein
MAKRGLEWVDATIEAVNDKGLKWGGEWHNFSKWANKDRHVPSKGETVLVGMDGEFVMDVAPAGEKASGVAGAVPVAAAALASAERERTITRLAVLKAAVEFLGTRMQAHPEQEIKADHVLALATKFESWVNRPSEEGGE